ncbi:MAG: hypothetical protein V4507_11440 [Verrucomicrobiota bacterium]
MSKKEYLSTLKLELFKNGIFGKPAQRLLEELDDHFFEKREVFLREGASPYVADQKTILALGSTQSVVQNAIQELQKNNLFYRYSFLTCGIGFFVFIGLLYVSITWSCFKFIALSPYYKNPLTYNLVVPLLDWIPWFLGLWIVHKISMKQAMGWKNIQKMLMTLGLVSSMTYFTMSLQPYELTGVGSGWFSTGIAFAENFCSKIWGIEFSDFLSLHWLWQRYYLHPESVLLMWILPLLKLFLPLVVCQIIQQKKYRDIKIEGLSKTLT